MPKQRFTSPGTWTCPPTVTYVNVFVVGGGGGGGAGYLPSLPDIGGGGAGGGGRVRYETWVPVSAPVPVTVGAGGSAGVTTFPKPSPVSDFGGTGGTSAFGPLGPGPIPLIPAPTIAAGGGGGGSAITNVPQQPLVNAPPIGGGGGGGSQAVTYKTYSGSGAFGSPGTVNNGGGALAQTVLTSGSAGRTPASGVNGYGGGGAWYNDYTAVGQNAGFAYLTPPGSYGAVNAQANFGGGGYGGLYNAGPSSPGGAGGSGVVIVEWWQ